MATRSEIWRTFVIRVPAARTVAERSASNRRAIVRAGGGGPTRRAGERESTVIVGLGRSPPENSPNPGGPCSFAQADPRARQIRGYPRLDDDVCLRVPGPGLA